MSIELFFDAASEAGLRTLAGALSDDAIVSEPLVSGARPHLTLSVFESLPELALGALIERVAADFAPLSIHFSAHGRFPRTGVTFLAPQPSLSMLLLQQRVHAELVRLNANVWEHYTPARWFPHCTLTLQSAPAMLERIARLVDAYDGAAPKHLPTLGLARILVEPIAQLAECALKGRV
jgi:2'-5' RNA ligase